MLVRAILAVLLLTISVPALAQHQHATTKPEASGATPLFDNLGTYTHPVTTSNPRAQKFFDQGLRLYYGFNHDEAIRAFREAARLDPKCAMAWWGVAISAGPNINFPMDPEHSRIALEAIAKAKTLAPNASKAERAYIDALAKRYSESPAATRSGLDSAYADAMGELAKTMPDDVDVLVLYAESMMDLSPWNQWAHDGEALAGTEQIVATLESALQKRPDHPGANHFYIHAVEASPDPGRANDAAKRLETLVPGAGHLVHMPSHIYARTGRYDASRIANRKAVDVDEKYIAEQKPQGIYSMMYYPHNIHFIWFSACMEGRSAEALEAARKVSAYLPLEMARQMPMVEFVPPLPILTLARFGRWEDALRESAPAPELHYSTGLWLYARGLAYASTGRLPQAHAVLDSLTAVAKAMPADQMVSINYAGPLLRVAIGSLTGEIAMEEARSDDAIRDLTAAVAAEDSLHYDEPPTWCYPVRQSLGVALLKAKRAKEAEAVYREDLKRHPENGWSLFGLAQALRAQNNVKDATDAEQRFAKTWAKADVSLTASAY